MTLPPDFQGQWRDRLASGSKPASKTLAAALKEDPSRLPAIARLASDAHPMVRLGALRALADVAPSAPALVAVHAKEVVEGLAASEPDAQISALECLAEIARLAPAEAALALPFIADILDTARRPTLREAAARCLGRLGSEVPHAAPDAAHFLAGALGAAAKPRHAQEAREILAALTGIVPNLPPPERAALAPRIHRLRGHPNLQVRERAGRLERELTG